jgi:hypothetical protein
MWCRPAVDTDNGRSAVHLTVMTGRSVQLMPNVYHRYTLSGADCTHFSTNMVRSCGRSGVQLSSSARALSSVAVRVWNWSRRRACTGKGEPSGSPLTVECSSCLARRRQIVRTDMETRVLSCSITTSHLKSKQNIL